MVTMVASAADRTGGHRVMSVDYELETAVVWNDHDDDRNWVRALRAAVMKLGGSWNPADEAPRGQLLEAIREQGYPRAVLEYLPAEGGSLPRIYIWREGKAIASRS